MKLKHVIVVISVVSGILAPAKVFATPLEEVCSTQRKTCDLLLSTSKLIEATYKESDEIENTRDALEELGWERNETFLIDETSVIDGVDKDGNEIVSDIDAEAIISKKTVNGKTYYLFSFRGTAGDLDVKTDADTLLTEFVGNRQVHSGFLDYTKSIYQADKTKEIIYEILDSQQPYEIIVTGHSLGGAAAQVFTALLQETVGVDQDSIKNVVFGSPGVGNKAFADQYLGQTIKAEVINEIRDFVPVSTELAARIPPYVLENPLAYIAPGWGLLDIIDGGIDPKSLLPQIFFEGGYYHDYGKKISINRYSRDLNRVLNDIEQLTQERLLIESELSALLIQFGKDTNTSASSLFEIISNSVTAGTPLDWDNVGPSINLIQSAFGISQFPSHLEDKISALSSKISELDRKRVEQISAMTKELKLAHTQYDERVEDIYEEIRLGRIANQNQMESINSCITLFNASHIGSASCFISRSPYESLIFPQESELADAFPENIQEGNIYTDGQIVKAPLDIGLAWNQEVAIDLDSHLVTPNGEHIYFADRGSLTDAPNAFLYRDSIPLSGKLGAEQTRLTSFQSGQYRFYVYNFSDSTNDAAARQAGPNGLSNSQAVVSLYEGGGNLTNIPNDPDVFDLENPDVQNVGSPYPGNSTFRVPTNQPANTWYVFRLDTRTGIVYRVDRLGNSINSGSVPDFR